MMIQYILPEESVIGGASVTVPGEQFGDIGVRSWGVKGLGVAMTGWFRQFLGGLVLEWASQTGAV